MKPRKKQGTGRAKKQPLSYRKAAAVAKRLKLPTKKVKRLLDLFMELKKVGSIKVPRLTYVGLAFDDRIHDTPRHYARTEEIGGRIVIHIAPDILKLPWTQQEGVMMHEFGHAALMDGYRGGHGIGSYDAKERRADRGAEALFDKKIYYTKKFGVETTARGARPRPAGLR